MDNTLYGWASSAFKVSKDWKCDKKKLKKIKNKKRHNLLKPYHTTGPIFCHFQYILNWLGEMYVLWVEWRFRWSN